MKIYFLMGIFFLEVAVQAQCPPPDSIRKNIISSKIAGVIPNEKKLSILLDYRKKMLECHIKNDSVAAWLLYQIGWAYADSKFFSEASNYFLQSINLTRSTAAPGDPSYNGIITKYYWLASIYDSLNNLPAKRRAIDSCILLSERLHRTGDIAPLRGLTDRAQYFYNIGEYRLCINDALLCEKRVSAYLALATTVNDLKAGKGIAENTFHWHINALLELKDFAEAEKLLVDKIVSYKTNREKDNLAITYAQLAAIHEKNGKISQGLADFNRALEIYKKNGNAFNSKQTLNSIGEKIYFNNLKDYSRALYYFRSALACVNHDNSFADVDAVESLNIYKNIANVYVEKGMFDTAFIYFRRAFDQINKDADETDIAAGVSEEFIQYKKVGYLFALLTDYGNAFKRKYLLNRQKAALEKAIAVYGAGDRLLAQISVSQFDADSKLFWRKNSSQLYENAVEACYLSADPQRAFYFFERSRAVLLNSQLSAQNWMNDGDITALAVLQKAKIMLNNAIGNETKNSAVWRTLHDSLRVMNENLYNLLQLVKVRNPLYYQTRDTTVITVQKVQRDLLKEDKALLEMFSGEKAVYSLLITGQQAVLSKIEKTEFETAASRYAGYLSNHSLLNKDFGGFKANAAHLYRLIFGNFTLQQKRLIVSLDGAYLPFESLIVENTARDPVYFIAVHAVSYTYSARYLFNNFVSTLSQTGDFLGIAPVNFANGYHLAELTGSDISLLNIESFFPNAHVLLKNKASRASFIDQFSGYKIVQLYAHASDSSARNEPVIYFNDSSLYLSELVPEKKPVTELIILSACETGNGVFNQGEGVFSFNRGFAALGIPSSVTNLWSVNSKATYALTELFYRYMSKGFPLDIALQKAKLEYMQGDAEKNQLPYYWAAPILVGKTDPIVLDKPFAWKFILAGVCLLLVVLIFFKKRNEKTNG